MKILDEFNGEWPWPAFQGHRAKKVGNTVLAFARTFHRLSTGSPYLYHRYIPWRSWNSSMVSALACISRSQSPKKWKTQYLQYFQGHRAKNVEHSVCHGWPWPIFQGHIAKNGEHSTVAPRTVMSDLDPFFKATQPKIEETVMWPQDCNEWHWPIFQGHS